jgi:hypothetical protein
MRIARIHNIFWSIDDSDAEIDEKEFRKTFPESLEIVLPDDFKTEQEDGLPLFHLTEDLNALVHHQYGRSMAEFEWVLVDEESPLSQQYPSIPSPDWTALWTLAKIKEQLKVGNAINGRGWYISDTDTLLVADAGAVSREGEKLFNVSCWNGDTDIKEWLRAVLTLPTMHL